MQVIRDEISYGLMMIPLFVQWGIRRCNQEGCTNMPNTIIAGTEAGTFGLCEEHYQAGNKEGGYKYKLVFDNFDAFKQKEKRNV